MGLTAAAGGAAVPAIEADGASPFEDVSAVGWRCCRQRLASCAEDNSDDSLAGSCRWGVVDAAAKGAVEPTSENRLSGSESRSDGTDDNFVADDARDVDAVDVGTCPELVVF